MKIENANGFITYFEIDQTEEGWEDYEGYVIDRLKVTKEARGKGIGRDLLQQAIKAIGTADFYLVCCPLDSDTDFTVLCEFYESEGFELVDGCEGMPYPLMQLVK